MGWFSSSKPEPATAISREKRQECWESRDAYFACLDKAGVLKAGEEGKACTTQNAAYEKNCARSWVRELSSGPSFSLTLCFPLEIEYFNQRRILAERQKNMLAQMNSQAQEAKVKSP
jgi:cytochrome c oxidase assembly factor 6